MTSPTLVIGARGYVGRCVTTAFSAVGIPVVRTVRSPRPGDATSVALRNGSDLDAVLARYEPQQVVMLPQLGLASAMWMVERIDGPRWLVFSSAQMTSHVEAPGSDVAAANEAVARDRGAVVLRPTMIFGRGGDVNISRLIRFLAHWRVPLMLGNADALVQPVHVDDMCALVVAHRLAAPKPGLYPIGGDEVLPMREVVLDVAEILGLRFPPLSVSRGTLTRLAPLLRFAGVRPDQLDRLGENKTVATTAAREAFGWAPEPFAHRLEQACAEVLGGIGGRPRHLLAQCTTQPVPGPVEEEP